MITVNAKLRTEDFGSAGSRRLVRAGLLPAEVYGKNVNMHIVLNAHDFDIVLRKLAVGAQCELNIEGKTYKCIFKELQENIMYGTLLHADFQLV